VTSVKGQVIDAWYSGKAHRHGGNVQALMRPDGLPLSTGPAEPGSVHHITAARRLALLTQRWAALQHITADPGRITQITHAALVLTQFEHKYIS
jgi:hypothetical protein